MSTPEESHDLLGLGIGNKPTTQERIRGIKPGVPGHPLPDMSAIDAAADGVGYVSRESRESQQFAYRPARGLRAEPMIPLNMRTSMILGESFRRFCEENRYSYPEGLAEIMRRAGLPIK